MYRIFRASEKDLDLFLQLRMALFKELGEITENTDLDSLCFATKNYFIKNIENGFICWFAEKNGKVVGSGGLSLYTRPPHAENLAGLEGHIMNIYTLPEHRGKGIATSVVKTIVEYSKEIGIKKLWLHASDNGRPIYEKQGFKSNKSEMELVL